MDWGSVAQWVGALLLPIVLGLVRWGWQLAANAAMQASRITVLEHQHDEIWRRIDAIVTGQNEIQRMLAEVITEMRVRNEIAREVAKKREGQ